MPSLQPSNLPVGEWYREVAIVDSSPNFTSGIFPLLTNVMSSTGKVWDNFEQKCDFCRLMEGFFLKGETGDIVITPS